jgi:hypothetical protein
MKAMPQVHTSRILHLQIQHHAWDTASFLRLTTLRLPFFCGFLHKFLTEMHHHVVRDFELSAVNGFFRSRLSLVGQSQCSTRH